MRSIRHPGPVSRERVFVVPCTAVPLRLTLAAGISINEAIGHAFAQAGFAGGYVRLAGARVDPMRYVIPAAAPDGAHAAWYSEILAPAGVAVIEDAGLVVGRRDGEPFLHCHGLWTLADGTRRMGHLLPLDSCLSEPVEATAWGLAGALFDVRQDEETNFRLFRAVPAEAGDKPEGLRALACTIKPNEDIAPAIERLCREHGISSASVHGIGSLVGATFTDAPEVTSYATEVLVTAGRVAAGRCDLDIALVGMDGAIGDGRLQHDGNVTCVTFELLVVEEAERPPARPV